MKPSMIVTALVFITSASLLGQGGRSAVQEEPRPILQTAGPPVMFPSLRVLWERSPAVLVARLKRLLPGRVDIANNVVHDGLFDVVEVIKDVVDAKQSDVKELIHSGTIKVALLGGTVKVQGQTHVQDWAQPIPLPDEEVLLFVQRSADKDVLRIVNLPMGIVRLEPRADGGLNLGLLGQLAEFSSKTKVTREELLGAVRGQREQK